MATRTFTHLYDSYDDAVRTVQALEAAGVPHDDISLVANNAGDQYSTTGTVASTAAGGTPGTAYTATSTDDVLDDGAESTGAGTGATVGTIIGGGAGLLAGLGMLAIPGVGPIVAAGWLIATLTGAGVGAAGGGILGSLVGAGVPEEHAHVYAEGVRRGGTLVTVRADDSQRGTVEQILNRYSPVDPDARAAEYRAGGWSRFDESNPAYAAGGSPAMGTSATTGAGATGLGTTGAGTTATMADTTGTGAGVAGPGGGNTASRL